MKVLRSTLIAILLCLCGGALAKDRLIVMADMGNEPDEEQQMVHMIMCNNEFDLEGLIAVTGKFKDIVLKRTTTFGKDSGR